MVRDQYSRRNLTLSKDEQKPKCGRCIKAKIECDGYRELTVIQYAGGRRKQKPTPAATAEEESRPTRSDFTCLSPWMNLKINPDELFTTYTSARLTRGFAAAHPSAVLIDRRLADECFLALSTSYFAHDHKEKHLVERGLKRYGAALSKLHATIAKPECLGSYDILEAVLLMALFETLISDKQDGGLAHALGMQRLLEIRGPETFQNPAERTMFQIARLTIAYASLVCRKPTILAQPEWKIVPWAKEPQSKSHYQYLVDVLIDCPTLLCMKDKALAIPRSDAQARAKRDFVAQACLRLEQLREWKQGWELIEAGSCSDVPALADTPLCYDSTTDTLVPAWKSRYIFTSTYHCQAIALYHSIRIHIHRMMRSQDDRADTINIATSQSETFESGIEICRCINYHLDMAQKGDPSFTLRFPLRMAWEGVQEQEPSVGAWLQAILQIIRTSTTNRWAVAGYLC